MLISVFTKLNYFSLSTLVEVSFAMKKVVFFLNISSYSRVYMKMPVRPSYGRATSQSGKMQLIFLGSGK